jgi:cytoskeletal protein CcmA (bactofilin family)
MKTILKYATLLLVALFLFLPLQSAGATSGEKEGQVIFGQSFTLKSGETMNGDLVVFGGSATIEQDAVVNGSTVLFGGNLTINGSVNGDVAIAGGTVTLGPSASITGNLTTIGASLDRADGSVVEGQIYNTATSWIGNGENSTIPKPVAPAVPTVPSINLGFKPFISIMNGFGQALGLGILAMLLMLFLAPHADKVAHAVMAQPLTAGGLGLLTLIVSPIAIVLCVVTLILIPVAPILIVALVAAGVFGWISIGYEIGQHFTNSIHQDWHPAFSAGLGTFALTLVAEILTGIPVLNCVGWLVPFLLSMAALGAVLMTRFGTKTVLAPSDQTPMTHPPAAEPPKVTE